MRKNNLESILNDKTSGSTELVLVINKFFKDNIDNLRLIRQSIEKIEAKMKNFEVAINYLKSFRKILVSGKKEQLERFVNNFELENMNSYLRIFENLKPLIRNKKRVFTMSNSQTVYEILKLWFNENRKVEIVIAESRPVFEGRILAKKLLKLGVKVLLIPDCNSAACISKCDVVIIGADKILSNGDVVNKTGSKNAAIISKYYDKPFVVIASQKKFSKQSTFSSKLQNSSEIWKFRHKYLKIENHYFEVVPKKLITKIISDGDSYK